MNEHEPTIDDLNGELIRKLWMVADSLDSIIDNVREFNANALQAAKIIRDGLYSDPKQN